MNDIDYSPLRSLTARELCRALEHDGFTLARQRGSHQRYTHLGTLTTMSVTVPYVGLVAHSRA